jgi:biotin operon repressor
MTGTGDNMADTASDARTFPFFQVENAVIDHYGAALGPYGLAVYFAIVRHTNQKSGTAFPGMDTIAAETGMSRKRVWTAVKQLKTLGLLKVQARKRDDGGQTSNEYTLVNVTPLVPPHKPVQETTTAIEAPPCVHGTHPPVSEVHSPCVRGTHEQDESNQTNLDNTNTKDSGAPAPGAPDETPPTLPVKPKHTKAERNALWDVLVEYSFGGNVNGNSRRIGKLVNELLNAGVRAERYTPAAKHFRRSGLSMPRGLGTIQNMITDYDDYLVGMRAAHYDDGLTDDEAAAAVARALDAAAAQDTDALRFVQGLVLEAA